LSKKKPKKNEFLTIFFKKKFKKPHFFHFFFLLGNNSAFCGFCPTGGGLLIDVFFCFFFKNGVFIGAGAPIITGVFPKK